MSQLLLGKGHTCAPRTTCVLGGSHRSELREGVERGSECRATHTDTLSLPPSHHCLNGEVPWYVRTYTCTYVPGSGTSTKWTTMAILGHMHGLSGRPGRKFQEFSYTRQRVLQMLPTNGTYSSMAILRTTWYAIHTRVYVRTQCTYYVRTYVRTYVPDQRLWHQGRHP